MSKPATIHSPTTTPPVHDELAARYRQIRAFSEAIAEPLTPEDCVIQSMPDVSPTRWHLAHTTWFFETFLLKERPGFTPFHPLFDHLFNSYYNTVGEQFPRSKRGLLSRPTVEEVFQYREDVDRRVLSAITSGTLSARERTTLEIGLNHEQQHQELMLTDIKHVFSCNPLMPAYSDAALPLINDLDPLDWLSFPGGLCQIGNEGSGFAYDNEFPRHKTFLQSFQIASRLVTNSEYLAFIKAGGYEDPRFWLSMGWQTVQQEQWKAPLYWLQRNDQWLQFTLSGLQPIDLHAPVCHVSYFEADAYASWAGMRLPSEAEWEIASADVPVDGLFSDDRMASHTAIHPRPPSAVSSGRQHDQANRTSVSRLSQMFGEVWQWTRSPYVAYPGYSPAEGAIGEYNGKFMCGQFVLRGASCATPSDHTRRTYRNFFPPDARWQFSGIRLAGDLVS